MRRECTASQRRHQLADAFGVTDLDSHVAFFDRHRTVQYSHVLLKVSGSAGCPRAGACVHSVLKTIWLLQAREHADCQSS